MAKRKVPCLLQDLFYYTYRGPDLLKLSYMVLLKLLTPVTSCRPNSKALLTFVLSYTTRSQ